MESSGAKNEDGGIDKKRQAEGQRGIEYGVTHRFAPVARGGTEGARLHDAGMKVKIVRHDRGAKDADGDVEHFAVTEDFGTGDEADGGFAPERMSEKDFVSETSGDRGDERDDESFDKAKAAPLQCQDDENVECGDENAGQQRQAEKKFQGDGRAQNLGKIAGGNGYLTDHPEKQAGTARVLFAARLGQITPRGNSEFCRESLQKHRHQVADEDDAQKRVAEL